MLSPGSPAPELLGLDHQGRLAILGDGEASDWTLVWFGPKATGGCLGCGGGLRQLLPYFGPDVTVIGADYSSPRRNALYKDRSGWQHELWSITEAEAGRWDAKRDPEEGWPTLPRRLAYLINPDGVVVRAWAVADPATFPQLVLDTLGELRPPVG